MIGLLPKPVEQGSPSDDPLLLVSDDEDTRKTPAIRPSSHSGKSTGSRSAARIIDFDAAIQGRSSVGEIVRDYEVPIHGSDVEYDGQDYGFDSGDSDDEEMGNDTFVNVAGARSKLDAPADRQEETTLEEEDENGSHLSSRSNSPFLSQEAEIRFSSPAHSLRAVSPAKEASPRVPSSPVITSIASPARSVAASLPSPFLSRSINSPRLNRSTTVTPAVHSHGLPSPAPSSPLPTMEMEPEVASPPRYARSQTGTPRANSVVENQELESAPVPASPAYSEKFSVGMPSAPSSPLSTRSRDRSATPRFTEQLSTHSQEMDEEEMQDSWNASPLLLPGTPSALGLFMPEEADGMSTPYSHVGAEPDSPAPDFGPPTRSITHVESRARAEALASPPFFDSQVVSPARSVAAQVASPARPSASQIGTPARTFASGVESPTKSATLQVESPALSSAFRIGTPASPVPLQVDSPSRSTNSQTAELPVGYTQSPRRSPICLPQKMILPGEMPVVYTSSPRKSPVCLPAEVVEEQPLPVVYTHSPRKSPLAYTQSPRKSPVCLPAEMENDDEEESEDKENMAPVQSTTPILSPPTLKATPPMYAFTFSPRIASPLRITHNQASTPKRDSIARTSQSPIPAVESFHERFAEVDECPSADVTLEGNSADWSLSEEGSPEVDGENGLGLNLQGQDQEEEDENLSGILSTEEGGVHQEEEDDLIDSSNVQEDDRELGVDPNTQLADVNVDSHPEDEEDEAEEQESEEEDEGQESNLIAPASTVLEELEPPAEEEESTDSEESPSSDEEEDAEEDETAQEEMEENIPASPAPVKIVLKLINRGIVKIEPPTSPVRSAALAPEPEARSTTPAYDPPRPIVAAPATQSAAPAASTLYSTLPTTPITARLSPLVSTTPLGSPPVRQRSPAPQQSLLHSSDYNTLQVGPSNRPPSRLSRQVPDSPEQEESDSIRVRSPRSLGLELEDAEADNSMRSVVEVSSLDPRAAARAAAILKLVSLSVPPVAKLTSRTTHTSNMGIFRN